MEANLLPLELWVEILSYLHLYELGSLALVSQHWRELSESAMLWHYLWLRNVKRKACSRTPDLASTDQPINWKLIYKEYGVPLEWDPYPRGPNVVLYDQRSRLIAGCKARWFGRRVRVFRKATASGGIRANKKLTFGVHYWELRFNWRAYHTRGIDRQRVANLRIGVVTDGFDITGAKDPLLSKTRVDYAFLCCEDTTFSGSVPGLRGEVHRPLQLQRKDIVGVQLEFLEEGQMATLSFFKKGVLICACLLPYVDLSTGFRPAVLGFGGRDISVRIVAYENRTPVQRVFY